MITVSDAWKSTMNQNTAYTTGAVISLVSGTVLTVAPADVCLSTNKFTDGAGMSSFPVGAAMCRTMQIELDNHDERYAGVDFLGAVIRLSLNYKGESISLGTYTVRQPETYGGTVILTAQDDMYKADRPFTTGLTYPTTAGALWAEICSACGISDGMTGGIPQSGAPIAAAPSSDLTCRAVLGYIAMLSGGNARINRLGNLEIVGYGFDTLDAQRTAGTAEGIHDLVMWRSLRLDTEDVTVTGVQTTAYDGDESAAVLVGEEGYVLSLENPLIAGREQEALAVIGAALIGKSFRGFSGEYIAYPLAEFADGARITDRRGNHYYTVITDVDFTWSAATVLSNSAESPMRNASKYTPPTVTTLQRAAQMVAAERTARQTAVQTLADALAAAGGMHLTTETAAGGGTIYYLHDQQTLAGSNIVLKLTAEALGISTDGGQTYPTGWNFATGTTITNLLETIGINADWINAGALTVTDEDGNVILNVDTEHQQVNIGGFGVGPSGLNGKNYKVGNVMYGCNIEMPQGSYKTWKFDENDKIFCYAALEPDGPRFYYYSNGQPYDFGSLKVTGADEGGSLYTVNSAGEISTVLFWENVLKFMSNKLLKFSGPITFEDTPAFEKGLISLGTAYLEDGNVIIEKPDMDATASSAASTQTASFAVKDQNNDFVSWFDTYQETNGTVRIALVVRGKANGSVSNGIYLNVDKNGNRSVSVSDPALWRGALGLRTKTVTGTTDSNGFITLGLANTCIPLAARSSRSDDHVEFTTGSSSWWGRVTNKGAARGSASVTITVWYIEA